MLRIDNYSRLPSVTSAYSDNPERHDADEPRPVLLPPGASRPALATPLSKESMINRKAYTGYFCQHLVRFTMSSFAFGLLLAAAVLSGGTGIPLAVVTGTATIIAAGDACCALYNLIQVRNDREPLKTNDSIMLATKTLMKACGMSDSPAETAGDVVSFVLRIGIALSSMFLPSAHLPGSTAHTLSKVSAVITAALTLVGGVIDMYTARVARMQGNIASSATPAPAMVKAHEKSDKSDQPDEEELQRILSLVVAWWHERDRAQLHTETVSPAC
ncbi:hypothetical protein VL10_23795 [Leclercia adecarboxylata]|nr:hypothetical protein VL10_23795 [Leclercia adecarboxylata]KMN61131.1 hypothetical protein VK95_23540 [Leclercia sp. LK8]